MINNLLEQSLFEVEDPNIEAKNILYVEKFLDELPTIFNELVLQDGSRAAVLYNDALISQENKEILPPYEYFVFSRYGLTQFRSSTKKFLGWTITTNAIAALIELSNEEEVENLVVSEWKRWKRNRINKGLIPLKMVLRSVTVTGVHLRYGIEDFYNDIITKLNLPL